MDLSVNLEVHSQNIKLVKDISDDIISRVLNKIKLDTQKLTVNNKPDSEVYLCDNEMEDFPDGQWIVLDEWNETSGDEVNFIKSNVDKYMEKLKYSSKRKSYKEVDMGLMSTKRNKDKKPKTNIGFDNNNDYIYIEKEFPLDNGNTDYDTPGGSKLKSAGEGHISFNFNPNSTYTKFPEDKFYCEICDHGFALYENAIIHVETSHELSKATNVSALVRLPRNPQMLKMFCCALPDCPNSFSASSSSLLRCHALTMHENLNICKTISHMFCQLCKGEPFENEDALDLHLVAVHGVKTDEMKLWKKTPAYYYCIVCRKPIGSTKSWERHTRASSHLYRRSSLAQKSNYIEDDVTNEGFEEAVVMAKRDFSACKKEYELREISEGQSKKKSYATQKLNGTLSPHQMVPCLSCPGMVRKAHLKMHTRTKHPHASFQCKFFPKYKLQSCGKKFISSNKVLTHLRSHVPGIRMFQAIDRGLVKVPRDLRWMKCRLCGWCCNGQRLQAVVDHVRKEHPKEVSSPARITDFGCRLCGVVASGVRGYEKLEKHIEEKKIRSILSNKKL